MGATSIKCWATRKLRQIGSNALCIPPNYIYLHSHKHMKRAQRNIYAVYEQIVVFLYSLSKISKKMVVGKLTRL